MTLQKNCLHSIFLQTPMFRQFKGISHCRNIVQKELTIVQMKFACISSQIRITITQLKLKINKIKRHRR